MPAQHGEEPIRSLEGRLEQRWAEIVDAEDQPRDVILTLPELVVRGGHRLGPALCDLGLGSLIDEPDFSGISEEPGFRIDEILHNAILSVDRYGTESTGGTVTPSFGRSSLPERVVLTIDRPFLFAVFDKVSGVILYLGRLEHPD